MSTIPTSYNVFSSLGFKDEGSMMRYQRRRYQEWVRSGQPDTWKEDYERSKVEAAKRSMANARAVADKLTDNNARTMPFRINKYRLGEINHKGGTSMESLDRALKEKGWDLEFRTTEYLIIRTEHNLPREEQAKRLRAAAKELIPQLLKARGRISKKVVADIADQHNIPPACYHFAEDPGYRLSWYVGAYDHGGCRFRLKGDGDDYIVSRL